MNINAVVVTGAGTHIRNTTDGYGPGGLARDSRQLEVNAEGPFNILVGSSLTSFTLSNTRGETVALGSTGTTPRTVPVALAPDTYSLLISQQVPGQIGRPYDISLMPQSTATVTTEGGVLRGSIAPTALRIGPVQSHTVQVLEDGDYRFTLTLPDAAFSLRDADGRTVVSGLSGLPTRDAEDTGPEMVGLAPKDSLESPFPQSVEATVAAGRYTVEIVPRSLETSAAFALEVMPVDGATPTQSAAVERILQERARRTTARTEAEDTAALDRLRGLFSRLAPNAVGTTVADGTSFGLTPVGSTLDLLV